MTLGSLWLLLIEDQRMALLLRRWEWDELQMSLWGSCTHVLLCPAKWPPRRGVWVRHLSSVEFLSQSQSFAVLDTAELG